MSEDSAKPFLEVAARIAGRRIEELDQAQDEPAKLASEVVSRAQHEPDLGFFARLLMQATLPHSDPGPGVSEFQRTNGMVTVKIRADADYGMPFGHYPRLLLAWVTTEAVRRGIEHERRALMGASDLRDDTNGLTLAHQHRALQPYGSELVH